MGMRPSGSHKTYVYAVGSHVQYPALYPTRGPQIYEPWLEQWPSSQAIFHSDFLGNSVPATQLRVQPPSDLPMMANPYIPPRSTMGQDNSFYDLPQNLYTQGQMITDELNRLPTMYFGNISLAEALGGDTPSLEGRHEPAWSEHFKVAQKLAIVFCFAGYPLYTRQVHLARRCADSRRPQPPGRAQLAHAVAKEMDRFLTNARMNGRPLQVGGREVRLNDLTLVEVKHVSKGSLQPIFRFCVL
ncbi:hypothetical protein C8Q80DRAFT_872349 [Daedaleopsis nitida]|nr:hypothetical protein C8Q80DRAFT_872349 [Daedaleopsis nitida]